MTNQLEALLGALEDALEDGETQLWQPDLTDLVLPGFRNPQEDSAKEVGRPESYTDKQNSSPIFSIFKEDTTAPVLEEMGQEAALSQLEWEGGTLSLVSRQGQGGVQASDAGTLPQPSSPALLEQLQTLEDTQSSVEALSRTQPFSGSLFSRSRAGQSSTGLPYDPAALGDLPLAASAAAAQDEERARAVDRAFQRDSRRYDRGFSLY